MGAEPKPSAYASMVAIDVVINASEIFEITAANVMFDGLASEMFETRLLTVPRFVEVTPKAPISM